MWQPVSQTLKAAGGCLTHMLWCGSLRKTVSFFPSGLNSQRRHHFLIKRFAPAGFATQQAEAMVRILVRMTQSNMDVIYGDMVTKVQQVRSKP